MPKARSLSAARQPKRVLVVDDEPAIVESLHMVLESAGYEVLSAGTGRECTETVAREACDLVLLDLMLPDRSGIDVLKDVSALRPDLPVLMLTAYGSVEAAVEATRIGAANFLTKPWNNRQLLLEIDHQLERRRLRAENARLREAAGLPDAIQPLTGHSDALLKVFVRIGQVARTDTTVLVTGESGTGKELVARAIHASSRRAGHPFVTVNPGIIRDDLLDSTLFGHVAGAFPGAVRDRQGCFRSAEGGTIFLDEVVALSSETQAKLLPVIEGHEFAPVGADTPIHADVRILAASNADLPTAVSEGRLREDLFHRLNVIQIEVPPLRERPEDIPLLAEEFLNRACQQHSNHFLDRNRRSTLRFTPEAEGAMRNYRWPGNVRELRNTVERAVVLTTDEEIGLELLPKSIRGDAPSQPDLPIGSQSRQAGESLSELVERFERQVLEEELAKHGYNQTETAKALRMALSTLNQKVQRLGIDTKRRRKGAA